ncbi:MAG: glycoside hydrolase family 13 protein [Chthoniobacterales bacterium]
MKSAGAAAWMAALVILTGAVRGEAPMKTEEFVPDWAKDVVWYQIFPERFRNGDLSNDPTKDDLAGAYPDAPGLPWRVHPWTSDWYARQDYEKDAPLLFHELVQRRRYGGDLQGIIDQLGYLQDLGITAIYLNPVFDSPSSHKYDGVSFHHIDPNFGPDPAGDRALMAKENPGDPATWVWTSADQLALELIRQCHTRGIRIIFDGVFNHMGRTSWPFRDVVEKQQDSPYADWFTVKSWRDETKGVEFDYEGWFGHKTLPEFREDAGGIVAGPRDYIFAATRRWMDPDGDGDPSDGIDGWRLDVAFCVAHPFWKKWRKVVKGVNPEAYITAELIDPVPKLKPYLEGDEFDAVMNYNFAFACSDYFADEKTRISTTEFDRRLRELREAFPAGVAEVQQNLFGSHDTDRIGSHLVNRDREHAGDWSAYFNFSKVENGQYDPRKPTAEELEWQKLFAVFQMTYVGAPMIYYGDEVGMWGANDPDCRKPMVWEDLAYDDEATLPDGSIKKSPDKVRVNSELRAHYRKLIALRRELPALRRGSFETVLTDDERQLYGFRRRLGDEEILVVLNNSGEGQEASLEEGGGWEDRWNGGQVASSAGRLALSVPPRGALILVRDD